MVGTFGMMADVHPWVDPSFALGTTATFPQTDRYTDAGFDAQYQYQGNNYWFILRGSYIREYQNLATPTPWSTAGTSSSPPAATYCGRRRSGRRCSLEPHGWTLRDEPCHRSPNHRPASRRNSRLAGGAIGVMTIAVMTRATAAAANWPKPPPE
jgi:hypothetical protein